MSSKAIALILGSAALIVGLIFVLRGSPPEEDVAAAAVRPADSAGEVPGRLAARPNVFGADADTAARKRREEDASVDRGGIESPDSDDVEPLDRAGRARRAASQGSAGRDGSTIDVRGGLEDRSRPFDVAAGGDREPGDRPPTNRAWRDDIAALEGAEVYEPERTDPSQPVLSLFDGKGDALAADALAADAAIAKGVAFEDDGARFSPDSELAIPMAGKITGEAGSISFWVRPESAESNAENASLLQLRSHYEFADRLQIWKDGASVRMVFADSTGTESGAMYTSPSWAQNEWRLVEVTWGEGENALYVNGELVGKSQFEGQFRVRPDTLLHIGSNYSEDPRGLTGTINQFRVYDRTRDADEIGASVSQYPE